jgi:molybdopterin-guanine dinucleotide biosynthesis protein A
MFNITAVILAGGQSRRMGQDKALMELGGKPLIAYLLEKVAGRFSQVVIAANDADKYGRFGAPLVPDAVPGLGPIGGLAAALEAASTDFILALPCDMPLVPVGLLDYIAGLPLEWQVVAPRRQGRFHPLCTRYHKSCFPFLQGLIADGKRRPVLFFDQVRTLPLDEAKLREFGNPDEYLRNVNDRAAFEALRNSLRQ